MSKGLKLVKKILVEEYDKDEAELTEETTFDDLGIDSLDRVEMVMTIEEECGIDIPDEDVDQWATIGDVARYINEKAGD